jgi:hypothetical protein
MTRSPSLRVASGLGCQRCSYILDIRSCRCCQPRFGLYQRSYHETILGIYHTQRRTYIENRINLHDYTCKNAQVVTNLQQICSNAVPTTCQHDVFALLVPSLLTTCYKVVELNRLLLQVVPTTCHRPTIHQFVNKL